MFTCSAASTTRIFRGIPALSSALSGDGNNYFLSPFLLSLPLSASQLWSQPLLYDWTMLGNSIIIWRMLCSKNDPSTLQRCRRKGFVAACVPLLRLNCRLRGLFWRGQVKTLPQRCLCQSWFIPSALHIPPSPKDYHCLSWSCECPGIWVNYNSAWYSLV